MKKKNCHRYPMLQPDRTEPQPPAALVLRRSRARLIEQEDQNGACRWECPQQRKNRREVVAGKKLSVLRRLRVLLCVGAMHELIEPTSSLEGNSGYTAGKAGVRGSHFSGSSGNRNPFYDDELETRARKV